MTRCSSVLLMIAAAWALVPDPTAEAQARWSPKRCMVDSLAAASAANATTAVDTIGPGLTYRCILDPHGPWLLHVVTVDLRDPVHVLEGFRAKGAALGRERVSDMAARLARAGDAPIVGLNADFFDLQTGEVENNHVVRGEWVKGVMVTDSPHDEVDNAHTQFAVDVRGRPLIGRFALHGVVSAGGLREPLVGVNYRPPRREGLVLYNRWYGEHTPHDTSGRVGGMRVRDPDAVPPSERRDPAPPRSASELRADSARRLSARAAGVARELSLVRSGRRGDTVVYRVLSPGAPREGGATPIPASGAVLSATGATASRLLAAASRRGAVVQVITRLGEWTTPPRVVVGGWPRVVRSGTNVGGGSDSTEGTFPRFSAARHPRSAVGFTRDSSLALFVVVDGRRPWSVGMSLSELGAAMLALGAWDAMNLDGGGSSTLWIRGSVVNYPSDPAGERAVGNALFILERPPRVGQDMRRGPSEHE